MSDSSTFKPGASQRRYPRYELDTELIVTINGVKKRHVLRGRSLNISQAGMGGLFVAGWEVGTPVSLEFSVPVASVPVTVEAIVRSQAEHRYGFEFVNLTPGQGELITRTCRTLALLQ